MANRLTARWGAGQSPYPSQLSGNQYSPSLF